MKLLGFLFIFISACVSKDPERRTKVAENVKAAEPAKKPTAFALAKPKELKSIHFVGTKDKCTNIQEHIKTYHQQYLEPQGFELTMIENPCSTKDFKNYKTQFSFKSDEKIYTFQLNLIYVLGTKDVTTEKFETYKVDLKLVGSTGRMGPWNASTANSNTNLDRLEATLKDWFGRERVYANTYSCSLLGRDYFSGDSCAYPNARDLLPELQASYTDLIETQVGNYIKEFSKNHLEKTAKLKVFKTDKKNKDYTMIFQRLEKGSKNMIFALVLRFKFKQGYYFITDNSGNPVKAKGEVRRLDSYEFYRVDETNNKFKLATWNPKDRNLNIIHPNIAHYQFSLSKFLNKVLEKEKELTKEED
ncbi:MAG: hypothetical protein HRU09_10005 [Oligoflexales bacterium]|nr:hypothetical protein [Oligoflexales bacterium]